jgi:hypothetical protein
MIEVRGHACPQYHRRYEHDGHFWMDGEERVWCPGFDQRVWPPTTPDKRPHAHG